MFRQFLNGVDGMDQYLIFSMIVFLLFFTSVLLRVLFMRKETCETLANIPLDDSNDTQHES